MIQVRYVCGWLQKREREKKSTLNAIKSDGRSDFNSGGVERIMTGLDFIWAMKEATHTISATLPIFVISVHKSRASSSSCSKCISRSQLSFWWCLSCDLLHKQLHKSEILHYRQRNWASIYLRVRKSQQWGERERETCTSRRFSPFLLTGGDVTID